MADYQVNIKTASMLRNVPLSLPPPHSYALKRFIEYNFLRNKDLIPVTHPCHVSLAGVEFKTFPSSQSLRHNNPIIGT